MATLTFEGVRKVYGGLEVLHGIDVEISDGEFVVLVGPSGCGKSTLLRMIAGLEEISAGTIAIGGKVVNGLAPKARDISMVFQNYALYPHMTVEENMAFSMTLAGAPKADKAVQVRRAAEILDLVPYLDRKPHHLSGGQRQRVAMGRSIVRDPKVFLFDEPLSNLDAKLRVQMRSEIRALHRRLGTTMVYVTHDQIEAMTMADRIVVMQAGRIEQIGTPLDLYDRPVNVFVAHFIGSPSMNLMAAKASRGRVVLETGEDTGVAAPAAVAESRALLVGKRPEDIRLGREGTVAVTAESIEPTGADTFVTVRFGAAALSVVMRERPDFAEGDRIRATIDEGAVHLFDRDSGQRLA